MKKLTTLVFSVIFAINFVSFSSAQSAGEMTSDEKAVYVAAMNLLSDEDYTALENFQKENQTAAISILTDKQLSSLTKDKESLKLMKSKSMFCLGEQAVFPVYVRKQSDFYSSIIASFSKTKGMVPMESNPSVMALAAKISHEIYHVRNPHVEENEVAAIEHEQKLFESYMQKYGSALNLAGLKQVANDYVASLQNDLAIAKDQK